ncbi:hypothetical protein B0H19DRAFT_1271293 [Mycena capillaripes]|nr:hypothetical protein B0H19DRAFT_1271293 [Mycena capillaripes]
MHPRTVYAGPGRKFVLGIDIGTTYAGMSYWYAPLLLVFPTIPILWQHFSLLEPGRVPEILPITRFPAHDHIGADSKVPSVIYYDRSGMARACGMEALDGSVVEQAEEGGWEKAEWFKLHLRPATSTSSPANCIPPLPAKKSALDVFADFLRYLFQCAKTYIVDHYDNGTVLWIGVQDSMEFVLTHPNGWEGEQQAKMRTAAIIAGLIPNSRSGSERVHFVTEGEASLHFCIMNGLATDALRLGKGVVIIDAGGGTVDISAYRKVTTAKDESFEEIARPQCLFEGSIFVSNRAYDHLKAKLQGSKYADDVADIRECFDKTTKLRFRNTDKWSYIKFGRHSDKDEALNISSGQMKLSSDVVAGFYKPSLDGILLAVKNQCSTSSVAISSVLLVGGFAASEWLYPELKKHLNSQQLEVSRPDGHVNKAVADGAVSFYLDHYVSARISKHTYGIECVNLYNSNDAEHRARSNNASKNAAGDLMVPKNFSPILTKDTRVLAITEFRKPYFFVDNYPFRLRSADIQILCYRGQNQDPRWTDIESVHADTSVISETLRPQLGQSGIYYRLDIEMILSFGLTELKAQIAWVENGVGKRGPAELVY